MRSSNSFANHIMRTGLFLLAGVLLMTATLILGKLFTPEFPSARQWTVGLGVGVWFALTSFNVWVGVTKAGYTVREELPIFLLLFTLPTLYALLVKRLLG